MKKQMNIGNTNIIIYKGIRFMVSETTNNGWKPLTHDIVRQSDGTRYYVTKGYNRYYLHYEDGTPLGYASYLSSILQFLARDTDTVYSWRDLDRL